MKPRIKNRLANIIAKLAGSPDYEAGIEPKTPLEFYLRDAVDKILDGEIGSVTPAGIVTATGQMSAEQKSQTKTNLGIGSVFTFKGDVPTIADLPATGNSVGDVYFVESELGNFVWLIDDLNPDGFWDEFGQPIDLTAYQLKTVIVDVTGATPTIEPVNNRRYECGELTSLTISNPPATGEYTIVFTSGATPTVCAFDDIRWPNDEAPSIEANTEYEIIVSDNRGICSQPGWPIGGD